MSDYKNFIKGFDVTPDAVFFIQEGRVAAMNPAGAALCGARAPEAVLPQEALAPCSAPKSMAAAVDGRQADISIAPAEGGSVAAVRFESAGGDIAGFTRALRSPAGNLSIAAGLMRPVAEFIGNEEMEQYTAMITRDSLRIKRVADNTELFTRLMKGEYAMNAERRDVAEFMRELADTAAALARERMIKVTFDCESKNCFAEIDAGLFETAMLQLLSNALKYAGSGGGVNMTLKAMDGKLIIAVADTGRGFSKRSLATAFETWREEVSEDEPERGAGLGLAIVSAAARLHGGIAVVENSGSGALATVIIPESAGNKPAAEQSIRYDGGTMFRILTQLSDALGYKNYISKYLD